MKQKQINYYQDNNIKLPEKFDEEVHLTEGLSEEEAKELQELFNTGFQNWDKKEYETFVSLTEEYGRNEVEKIAEGIPTKTLEEVKTYSNAFWERINEIPDGQKIVRNIERKERQEKQKELSIKLLNHKCETSNGEYEDIKILYPNNNRQSEYSLEEDQFLIYITNKCGYGNWDDIIREIRINEDLMFNYYLKSRNKIEIQKRVDYLVKVLEKEFGSLSLGDTKKLPNINSTTSLVKSEKKEDEDASQSNNKMDIDEEKQVEEKKEIKVEEEKENSNNNEDKNDKMDVC